MTETSGLTIYHNPACGTSRNTLALLKDKGLDPHVVEYLKVGWTREGLTQLLTQMDAGPRDILRERGSPAEDLGLLDPACADETILAAMLEHPILVNRPIVSFKGQARLCRPAETVLDIL
jgi:arsenate reductase